MLLWASHYCLFQKFALFHSCAIFHCINISPLIFHSPADGQLGGLAQNCKELSCWSFFCLLSLLTIPKNPVFRVCRWVLSKETFLTRPGTGCRSLPKAALGTGRSREYWTGTQFPGTQVSLPWSFPFYWGTTGLGENTQWSRAIILMHVWRLLHVSQGPGWERRWNQVVGRAPYTWRVALSWLQLVALGQGGGFLISLMESVFMSVFILIL